MDQAVQLAPARRRIHYERRRPEDAVLYQVVQEHLETFLAQVELETGAGLPEFVKAEFDAFLECGILAHGFLRLQCVDCAHEKLVAFSCCPQRETICSSCSGCNGSRRESGPWMIDEIAP
ncbi:MAG: transposase zinc-binding domain-containing protein, partial [Nitrososphaera sp.]|nr:transposase zinc-binding domain-containing protein [Nitrososphaera sp.]